MLFVGGQFDRIEYLITGQSLSQAFECEGYATRGDVVLSKPAYDVLKKELHSNDKVPIKGEIYSLYDQDNKHWVAVDDMKHGGQLRAYYIDSSKSKISTKPQILTKPRYKLGNSLRAFVPASVWDRLIPQFKRWHYEIRVTTVLFINLDFGINNISKMNLKELQIAIKMVQKCVYRYKGSLNKFLFDDKGSTLIAIFGLPPIANFDDSTRGVLSALLISQTMKQLRVKTRIGVTTGKVYCGILGASGQSQEYGVLGDQVNLAARLMQHAKKTKKKWWFRWKWYCCI